ncbi:glutathione peroxidase [Shewanella psychrotolerans]|uniref:glutathione peroxidase n=1 Tax=Shewanella psychrotolerans TaxID=2864206 RepID=UPI001C6601DA|nr:glutathione peroxidase [Shewanella psychrotolerans]QYK00565.1 glutathione peroxidase [Shewanella psychrotolerans]
MKSVYLGVLLVSCGVISSAVNAKQCADFLDVKVRKLHSEQQLDLCQLTQGKPVLIVNTASHCGYTPQFKGLEKLHQKYKDDGLVVLGFPSNDFNQEEAQEVKTADVCYINYGVTFTMAATGVVTGELAQQPFKHLSAETREPNWNFNKYLVSADGKQIQRFSSNVKPNDSALIEAIEKLL